MVPEEACVLAFVLNSVAFSDFSAGSSFSCLDIVYVSFQAVGQRVFLLSHSLAVLPQITFLGDGHILYL